MIHFKLLFHISKHDSAFLDYIYSPLNNLIIFQKNILNYTSLLLFAKIFYLEFKVKIHLIIFFSCKSFFIEMQKELVKKL